MEIIRPGVVILRGVLTHDEQMRVIDIVQRHGGLTREDGDWNFFQKRGRTFDALSNYPQQDEQFIRDMFHRFRDKVSQAPNAEIPIVGLTHVLTWWYPDQKGMGWHRDGYGGNNGDKDSPVYSLTVGNSCTFEWRPVDDETTKESAIIESGDLIVFGGPQRMMLHRVKKIHLNTFEPLNVRINITFRKLDTFTKQDEEAFRGQAYEDQVRKEFDSRK